MLATIRKRLEEEFLAKIKKIKDKIGESRLLEDIHEDFYSFSNRYIKETYFHKYIKLDKKLKREDLSADDSLSYLIQTEFSAAYKNVDFKKDDKSKSLLDLKQAFRCLYFKNEIHRCCFCGQLLEKSSKETDDKDNQKEEYNISTIEHIFPKSKFPQYALCIDNWAPCCSECNSVEKGDGFFETNAKKKFYKALKLLGLDRKFGEEPLQIWRNVSFDFSNFDSNILINGKIECYENREAFQLLGFYGLDKRYKTVKKRLYNNLFNIIKHHKINSPEGLESFLECCLSSNMQEMISDFSINNYPKIWNDFLDYVLYDYNNLSALWEELKEYNKLAYFS